jgi:hypothetical protein
VIILEGPFAPKCIADTFVVSENVGEGGLGDSFRFEPNASARRERGRLWGMTAGERKRAGSCCRCLIA